MGDNSRTGAYSTPPVAVNVLAVGSTVAAGTSAGSVSLTTVVPTSETRPRSSPLANVPAQRNPLILPRPPTAQSRSVTLPSALTRAVSSLTYAPRLAPQSLARSTNTPSPQVPVPVMKPVNFNVKVINPDKKKECQISVLRGVTEQMTSTPQNLIEELQRQFGSQLVPTTHQFPVGYMKGSTKVTIRSAADLADIWTCVKKGVQVSLWCEGVHRNIARCEVSDSASDDEGPPKKKR